MHDEYLTDVQFTIFTDLMFIILHGECHSQMDDNHVMWRPFPHYHFKIFIQKCAECVDGKVEEPTVQKHMKKAWN